MVSAHTCAIAEEVASLKALASLVWSGALSSKDSMKDRPKPKNSPSLSTLESETEVIAKDAAEALPALRETVPEFLANMKNIREDSRYLHKITSPEAISEQKMEVGFDIDESFVNEGEHLENKNLGRSIIPATSSENNFDSDKSSSEPEKQLVNDLLATNTRNLPMKGVTPPPTQLPSKKSLGFGKQSKLLTQKGILKKVQALVRRARLDDEQKREKGEFANSAEMPVDTMPKINNEYGELVKHAKELDNEYFESMKHRAERTRLAGMVPVVTAACQDCCFPTEEVGESVGFRYLLNSIHKTAMFQKHGVKYEWGPLCWMHEAPKLEDNYRNIVPGELTQRSSWLFLLHRASTMVSKTRFC
ncbi:unnamed protein product [Haemonchus placei]|uniref:Dynein light chain n=1 Tax=Haemonchus placei TaxID=6290 RepID=A0A158QR75_HAEPC|nr:unnamed protein product [Haemonchus placei]